MESSEHHRAAAHDSSQSEPQHGHKHAIETKSKRATVRVTAAAAGRAAAFTAAAARLGAVRAGRGRRGSCELVPGVCDAACGWGGERATVAARGRGDRRLNRINVRVSLVICARSAEGTL